MAQDVNGGKPQGADPTVEKFMVGAIPVRELTDAQLRDCVENSIAELEGTNTQLVPQFLAHFARVHTLAAVFQYEYERRSKGTILAPPHR